ncbi:secretion activator [Sparganum proliferum]
MSSISSGGSGITAGADGDHRHSTPVRLSPSPSSGSHTSSRPPLHPAAINARTVQHKNSPRATRRLTEVKRTPSEEEAARQKEQQEKEEADRVQRLEIYVFVVRCIAYPFYSKPPPEPTRRYTKISKSQLAALKSRFQSFLSGELDIIFLCSDRLSTMVKGGGCSMHDFREVFRRNIECRVQCLPDIEGLDKSNIISAWIVKFDQICRGGVGPSTAIQQLQFPQPELILTKEHLYDMFQNVLNVKKYEHQILFNAMQLDSADEQAAQVRRELDGQLAAIEQMSRSRTIPKLVLKSMEPLYIEELRSMVGELMLRLESVPVTKGGGGFQKFKKQGRNQPGSLSLRDHSEDVPEINVNKLDIQLTFNLEIVVIQVKNLKHLPPTKMVYCTMEVEGGEKLQTDFAEAGKASWGTQGDFVTNSPLPVVKVKLYAEVSSLLSLESGRELARVVINPICRNNRQQEWYKMQSSKNCPDELLMQLAIRMDKPNNLKYCGYCYAVGRAAFRKWKKRFICLIQVSQYTFIMASYKEKKSEPLEVMQLDGFTVDYCDPQTDLSTMGGTFFFNLVKEGDNMIFATDDENERQLWVQAIYRATGQTHKPVPPAKSALPQTLTKPSATGAGRTTLGKPGKKGELNRDFVRGKIDRDKVGQKRRIRNKSLEEQRHLDVWFTGNTSKGCQIGP